MKIVEQSYIRNANFIFRRIIEEMILVPINKNVVNMDSIYTLNDLGAFLWEKLEKPCTVVELQQAVLDEYDVDQETVQTDLESFIEEMMSISAVEQVSA